MVAKLPLQLQLPQYRSDYAGVDFADRDVGDNQLQVARVEMLPERLECLRLIVVARSFEDLRVEENRAGTAFRHWLVLNARHAPHVSVPRAMFSRTAHSLQASTPGTRQIPTWESAANS